MEDSRLKAWSKLDFKSPSQLLSRLRHFERLVAASSLPANVKALRTNRLRHAREIREAALFTYGISVALAMPSLEFAMLEDQDYDCVARRLEGDTLHYTPIQLKRCVSHSRSLEDEITKLTKYADSRDLVVGMHVNRTETINFSRLALPKLPIAQLWFYGSTTPDQSRWFLFGDALRSLELFEYEYPNV